MTFYWHIRVWFTQTREAGFKNWKLYTFGMEKFLACTPAIKKAITPWAEHPFNLLLSFFVDCYSVALVLFLPDKSAVFSVSIRVGIALVRHTVTWKDGGRNISGLTEPIFTSTGGRSVVRDTSFSHTSFALNIFSSTLQFYRDGAGLKPLSSSCRSVQLTVSSFWTLHADASKHITWSSFAPWRSCCRPSTVSRVRLHGPVSDSIQPGWFSLKLGWWKWIASAIPPRR